MQSVYSQSRRWALVLLAMGITLSVVEGAAGNGRATYCSGDGTTAVTFVSENEGEITDGAVDTGMGVYRHSTDCKWVIKPVINENRDPAASRVVLHFDYLNLEAGFDFVKVYEQNQAGKLLGVFTGNTLPPTVVAATHTIYVRFESDGTGQRLGFKARWDTLGCPSQCGNRGSCVMDYCYCDEGYFGGDCSSSFCVGTKKYTAIIGNMMDHYRVLDEEDKLVLGEYPYRNNNDCRWLLQPLKLFAPYFTLEFLLMDTEIGRDLLIVFDGPNQNAPVLAQISGQDIKMPLLTSSSGELFLQFTSDKLKANWGFFAFWDTMKECGGPIGFCNDGGATPLLKEGCDPKVSDCTVYRPKRGYCLDEVYMPRQHSGKGRCVCNFGWFGGDCSFRWCLGAKILTKRIGSFTDHHDNYTMKDGLQQPYSTLDYRASSFCRWTITPSAPINFIVLRFEYFDLEKGSDFLFLHDGEYFDGSKELMDFNHTARTLDGTLTGDGAARMPQQVILSSAKSLFLNFQTDDANTGNNLGFKAMYEGVFCYGRKTMTAASGKITDGSPTNVRYYPRTKCLWQIKPDASAFTTYGSVVEVSIDRLSIYRDSLTLYDGDSVNSPILRTYSQQSLDGDTVTSSGREVTVYFETLCHSSSKCRDCRKSCLNDGCCDECNACNRGRAPPQVGMNMYGFDIPEAEFYIEHCECDLIPAMGSGWEVSWKVRPTTEFCRKEYPVTLTHWFGVLEGFKDATTYRNNEDCSWFIDVDPQTAGGVKVEKMDIYLTELNTDIGTPLGTHPYPDLMTIYKGHNRTSEHCFDSCVSPKGVYLWKDCAASRSAEPPQPSCMMTQQYGQYIACDPNDPYTYQLSCWDTPNHWTIAVPQARIDFQSSSGFVGGNFKVRWEAEVSSAKSSVVYGIGTTTARAGYRSVITVRARRFNLLGNIMNRTTGGAHVTLEFRYGHPVSGNETIYQTAIDSGDGLYTMSYVPKYAGVHTLYVKLFDANVAGSPFTVVVKPGTVDPNQCEAYDTVKVDSSTVGGLTGGRAGREYTFKIHCSDEFGNRVNIGSQWKEGAFMVKYVGLELYWGIVDDEGDGRYTAYFTIPKAGSYQTHILYKLTETTYTAIKGSPFTAIITKVTCPIVGEPPCNDQGTCMDNGKCVCNPGWDGEYCQEDLAKWLRIGIVVENAAVGLFIIMFFFNLIWQKCVHDQQMFERLQHDDTEEDW